MKEVTPQLRIPPDRIRRAGQSVSNGPYGHQGGRTKNAAPQVTAMDPRSLGPERDKFLLEAPMAGDVGEPEAL